jgi:glycosyltransferase involved in cell wall biosynthesis
MPAAAVVIPTRNRPREVQRAVASVRAQTFTDWELLVVDDASEGDTVGFLERFDDSRIRVERLRDHGERSAARNRGLSLVSSPAVLFLDDDDELLPTALQLLTLALDRQPASCAAVGAVIHEVDGSRRRTSFPSQAHQLDVRLELLAGWVALSGQTLMRTSLVRGLGGWREGLSVAEDQELWLRLCTRGPVGIVPEAVLIHRPHGLERDAPGFRDVEREVVARHLNGSSRDIPRALRAARAREHLRDADIAFQLSAYRTALSATIRGIATAPFLLKSPLVGRAITTGLARALVAGALPRRAADHLRAAVRTHRSRGPLGTSPARATGSANKNEP